MMNIPDIIRLEPNRVWRTYPGGETLDTLAGISPPKDSFYPEDWIASTTKAVNKGREYLQFEGYSLVNIDGMHYFLKDVFQKYPTEMLGKGHFEKYGANTQFLLKFLDSAERLHIQVHPTIYFAQKHLKSNNGKTEAYVILDSREDVSEPYIYMGFNEKIDKSVFKKNVEQQNINDILPCLNKIPVRAGDVFIVPGGFPHAIGEGVFMIEIMEPTDFVARLEFERGGHILPFESRFMGRDIDFGIDMLNFDPLSTQDIKNKYFITGKPVYSKNGNEIYSLIDKQITQCFLINKLKISSELSYQNDSFYIGIVSQGNGKIKMNNKSWNITYGDKFFVPYQTDKINIVADENLEIICAMPPY